jgi:hypothetical protein
MVVVLQNAAAAGTRVHFPYRLVLHHVLHGRCCTCYHDLRWSELGIVGTDWEALDTGGLGGADTVGQEVHGIVVQEEEVAVVAGLVPRGRVLGVGPAFVEWLEQVG